MVVFTITFVVVGGIQSCVGRTKARVIDTQKVGTLKRSVIQFSA